MLAVEVKNIKKTFQSKQATVEAVKDVSFEVKKGEIFGLLGPNGAGKSTTILMLTTLLQVTGGSAKILGCDVSSQDKLVREKIGVALQDTGIDNLLTARELFFTTARLWGYSKEDSNKRTEELLELVGLTEAADRRVKTYSGGMKRRLDLGLSLVHSPEVLFLDEPTTGLDTGSRRVLWDEIKRLREGGVTIILTTQYLEEADELADRIAIMYEGLIVQVGTPEELITKPATDYVAEFTKDIPRSKLLNAESIMNEKDKKPYENTVNYSDKIEKIASKVLKSESIFSVVDDNKQVIGSVSKKELIKALFAEDKNE